MPIGATNVSVNTIYNEANPGAGTPANESVGSLFRYSYFEGPNGNNTISYNAWGQQGGSFGADVIYGLTAKSNNLLFSDYQGLSYAYDNSTFIADVRIQNLLQAPPFPPPNPPSANDIVVEVYVYDSSFTYTYMQTGAINANAQPGGFDQTFTISNTSTPMINIIYWEVRVGTDQFWPGGANIQIDINGTNYVNTSLTAMVPPTGNVFNSGTYGNATMDASGVNFHIIVT